MWRRRREDAFPLRPVFCHRVSLEALACWTTCFSLSAACVRTCALPCATHSPIAMTKVDSERCTIRRIYCAGCAITLVPKNRSDRRTCLTVNVQSTSTGHRWLLDKAHSDGEARTASAQVLVSSQAVLVWPCLVPPKAPGQAWPVLQHGWPPAALRQLHRAP